MKPHEPSVATVYLTPTEPLGVDGVVTAILEAFPGSRITEHDYWRRRIGECEASLSEYEARTGIEMSRSPVESLRREYRLAQCITIPLHGGFSMDGYVGPDRIFLRARCPRPNETLGALVRFLRSLSLGRVAVWPDPERG